MPSGAALRAYSEEAVDEALRRLNVSRWLAVLAALGVLVSAGCLWFGEPAAGSATTIQVPAGSELCPNGAEATARPGSDVDYVVRCAE